MNLKKLISKKYLLKNFRFNNNIWIKFIKKNYILKKVPSEKFFKKNTILSPEKKKTILFVQI